MKKITLKKNPAPTSAPAPRRARTPRSAFRRMQALVALIVVLITAFSMILTIVFPFIGGP